MDPEKAYSSPFPVQWEDHCSGDDDDDDESPAVKGRVHQFYLVKRHPYEKDPVLESKIERAQEVITTFNDARAAIYKNFESKMRDHEDLSWATSYMFYHRWDWNWEKRNRARNMELLEQSFRKLSFVDDCEKKAKGLRRRLEHVRSPGLANERKIFKELTDLVRAKARVESDPSVAEENAEIVARWGSKDEIKRKIKSEWTGGGVKGTEIARRLEKHRAAEEKHGRALEGKLSELNKKKAKAYKRVLDFNRLQAGIKDDYDEYVATLNAAKEVAANKDIKGLQELINGANERFMRRWSKEKGFRDVYKKRVASSLGGRGLDLDGMLKNTVMH